MTACLHHQFTDASGNVECAKCGALWLAWTPTRGAAPDLLAALKSALWALEHGVYDLDSTAATGTQQTLYEQARAAIRKATPQENG